MERLRCTGGKLYLNREKLNRGGYDSGGRYFGAGEKLWYFSNHDNGGHVRASSRAAAKAKIRIKCPTAKFHR